MSALKERLSKLIKQNDIDCNKLERRAGLTRNFISNILYGKSKNPGIDSIIKLATTLNLSLDELVGLPSKKAPQNIEIDKPDLFSEIIMLILKKTKKCSNNLYLLDIFNAAFNIYSHSTAQNKIDPTFFKWYLETYLFKKP